MSINKPAATITENNISVYYNGTLYPPVNKSSPQFEPLRNAIKNGDWEAIPEIIDSKANAVKKYISSNSEVEFKDGCIFYKGKALDSFISNRANELMKEGFEIKHILNFVERLYKNPSYRAVKQLYKFLEHKSLPITEDGKFLAYKAVRRDYKDIYSGAIDNSVGAKPEVDRNSVNDDPTMGCSEGLHVGAISYVKQYGHFPDGPIPEDYRNRLVIVSVDPADVVCVPECSSHTKLRTCKYEVINEIFNINDILKNVVYSNTNAPLEPEHNPEEFEEFEYDPADFEDVLGDDEEESFSRILEEMHYSGIDGTDNDYFLGRSHGEKDARENNGYSPKFSISKKYMRGYRNGYEKS
jgi:hypothetical protein